KSGSHYYLIIEAGALGDVYEITGADSVNTSFLGCVQAPNCSGGPFYGDTLAFKADASTSTPVMLQWNFGNPEAANAADPNLPPVATPSGTRVTHQYSGMTPNSFSGARTVTATNISNSQMTSSIPVTLKKPTAAFGLSGTTLLFKQPD